MAGDGQGARIARWGAVAATVSFAFYESDHQNITYIFGLTFTMALAAAGAIFYVVTTGAATPVNEAWHPTLWPASRHLNVLAVLTIPAIAVAATAVAEQSRGLSIAVVAIPLFAIPWSVRYFVNLQEGETSLLDSNPKLVLVHRDSRSRRHQPEIDWWSPISFPTAPSAGCSMRLPPTNCRSSRTAARLTLQPTR